MDRAGQRREAPKLSTARKAREMTSFVPPRYLGVFLQDLVGFEATVHVTCFPSGALDVYVRRGEVVTIVQGRADWTEFGLSPELESDAGFDEGHPLVFDNYFDLFRGLVEILRPLEMSSKGIEELIDMTNKTMLLPQFASGYISASSIGKSTTE